MCIFAIIYTIIIYFYMYSCRKDACRGDLQHIDWCLWRSWHVIENLDKGYQCGSKSRNDPFEAWIIVALQGWGQEWKAAVGYLRHSGLQFVKGRAVRAQKTLYLRISCHLVVLARSISAKYNKTSMPLSADLAEQENPV